MDLITWKGEDEGGEELGFGACNLEECEELREVVETKYGGDEARFFGYWPHGFRWTCCAMTGDMSCGCDHHGTGSKPCCCDFCAMGKPVPDSIFRKNQQACRGLELSRGPDPRSFNPAKAQISEMMRGLFGMDLGEDSDGDSNTAASPFGGLTDLLTMAARMAGRNSPSGAAAFAAAQEAALAHGGGGGSSSSSNSGSAGMPARSVAKPQAGVQKEEQSSSSTGVAVSSNPCWLHGDNGVIV
ncbi:hypothetical protein OEZ86_006230 [Tetradesmus obliquus]|nr:hypothetical protein OEZ86_006230 [Tetradesmus obliquus]